MTPHETAMYHAHRLAQPAHRTEEVSRSLDAIQADCETGSRIWNECVKIRKALEQPAHSSEQDRRDAERYRYLREFNTPLGVCNADLTETYNDEELDRVVDAAMNAAKEGAK